MAESDTIRLTLPLINACRTASNGFTGATMRAFGLNFADAKRGWVWRLIGKQITCADYQKALAGRFTFGSKAKEKKHRLENHAEFDFAGSIPSTGPTKARLQRSPASTRRVNARAERPRGD